MSNEKHTPGPWHVDLANETVHGFSPEGEAIVVVYELGTNEADAHLIAAAPELLEYVASSASNGCVEARRLLAKATGGQQ